MNSAASLDNKIREWMEQGKTKAEMIVLQAEAMIGWPYVWGASGQDCTPAKREYFAGRSVIGEGDRNLIIKRCQVMNGSADGCAGCKYYPEGARTRIQDCQGFMKELMKAVGITLSGGGCTSMYADNGNWSIKGPISEMQPGQVCLVFKHIASTGKMDHVGLHIGSGQIIHCSGEVKTGKTSEKGWTHYAVPRGLEGDEPMPVWRPTIRKGSTGDDVVYLQEVLNGLGYDTGGIDGKFGEKTRKAVMEFQRTHNLGVDGIVGPMTWEALQEAIGEGDVVKPELYTVTIKGLTKEAAEALKSQYADAEMVRE